MADEILGTDLFGDPVIPRREGRGRPEHVWSRANSNKVLLAFARGLTVKEAATVIGISSPTLRKVYFSEVAKRNSARLKMEMTQLARLNDQAEAGNVAAEKELARQLEKLRMRDQAQTIATPKPKRRKGVKETRREEAWMAGAGDEDWGDLIGPQARPN